MDPRSLLAILHDLAAAAAAWYLAYLLRFNFDIPPVYQSAMLRHLWWVVPLQAAVFWFFGLYRGMWRYASLPDLQRIVFAVGAAVVGVAVALYFQGPLAAVPRSVLVMDPILLLLVMGGSRLAYRAWKEHRLYGGAAGMGKPVLVLGAGDAAASLIKDMARSQEWRVVGLLDDNPGTQGRLLQGVKIWGPLPELPDIARKLGVEHAIIAMPSARHSERRRALDLCAAARVKALTVPSFDDLVSGKVTVSTLRRVELDDLLGRDPVALDDAGLHRLIEGNAVLVTGAGGSIGAELCRQVARFAPGKLVMLELNEFGLYQLEQEFARAFPRVPIVCAIGDAKNPARVAQVFQQHRPSVVFHAAAYKHVPLMEVENAWEAVTNNVLGTYVVAKEAIAHGASKFVLVSTDKAVNPANVMGASKRLAEMVCQALQSLPPGPPEGGSPGLDTSPLPPLTSFPSPGGRGGSSSLLSPSGGEVGREGWGEGEGVRDRALRTNGTRFVMVRFGNVLGSAGSVIPKFREQIARGGPVTVTHPEITRYFMSIPEACQLVLQAGLMGSGGEIFVLEMGEPVKIVDLARDLVRLSGLSEEEIRIEFTGLRPGEKLYEELLADDEATLPTPHPKLRVAVARSADGAWLGELLAWLGGPPRSDEQVRRELPRWVPEYGATEG